MYVQLINITLLFKETVTILMHSTKGCYLIVQCHISVVQNLIYTFFDTFQYKY